MRWHFLYPLALCLACSSFFLIGCNGVAARAELQSKQALDQNESLKQRIGNMEGDITTTQSTVSTMKTDIKNQMETMGNGLAARVGKIEGDMVSKQSWVTNSPWMVVGIVAIVCLVFGGLLYVVLRLFVVAPKERSLGLMKRAVRRAIASDDNDLDEGKWATILEAAKQNGDLTRV